MQVQHHGKHRSKAKSFRVKAIGAVLTSAGCVSRGKVIQFAKTNTERTQI